MIMTVLFLLGRILLGGFFIYNAYQHLRYTAGLAGYAQSKGLPYAKQGVIITGIVLLLGGLSIITGFFIVLGMWLLVIFLVVTNFTIHRFWQLADPMARSADRVQFMKNAAIVGALLMMSALFAIIG